MSSDLGPADVLTPTTQVRLELRARPGRYLTTATLCELTGLSVVQVQHAISHLSKRGHIMRALQDRQTGQAYAWNYRGMN